MNSYKHTIIITVTGVQYAVKRRGIDLLDFLRSIGYKDTKVQLVAEPDNPYDHRAVSVRIDYEHSGYIAAEELDVAHALLDADGYAEGVVCANDYSKTFFIELPDPEGKGHYAMEHFYTWQTPKNVVVDSDLCIPVQEDERKCEMIARDLKRMKITSDTLSRFVDLSERYVPICALSINKEDAVNRRVIYLRMLRTLDAIKEGAIEGGEQIVHRLKRAAHELRETIGDYHKKGAHYAIFKRQTDKIREAAEAKGGFFYKYCKLKLGASIEKAERDGIVDNINTLDSWLRENVPDSAYAIYSDDMETFANKLNYASVSRSGLYVVYAHLLTLLYLKKQLAERTPADTVFPNDFSDSAFMEKWDAMVEQGLLTADYKLADTMTCKDAVAAIRLLCDMKKCKFKWKPFELFWGIKFLAQYNKEIEDEDYVSANVSVLNKIFGKIGRKNHVLKN